MVAVAALGSAFPVCCGVQSPSSVKGGGGEVQVLNFRKHLFEITVELKVFTGINCPDKKVGGFFI